MPSEHVHLLIIVHGLWGATKHVEQLAKEAQERCAKDKTPSSSFKYDAPPVASLGRKNSLVEETPSDVKLVVYSTKTNEGTFTYDGIDFCAERVCDEIDAEVTRINDSREGIVKRFSIVGYSLGGLIARYAIGLLYSRKPSFFVDIRPVNFATIASPTLGIARGRGAFHGFRYFVGARMLSRTGRQLHGIDRFQAGRPLLEVMTLPTSSFYQALTAFERIEIYANILKDWNVLYPTGAIAQHDPFAEALFKAQAARSKLGISDELPIRDLREGGIELKMDEKYPPVVLSWSSCESIPPIIDDETAVVAKSSVPRFLRPSSYPFWPTPVRYLFIFGFPIALPLFLTVAFSLFTVQSIKSGRRISTLRRRTSLSTKESRMTRVGLIGVKAHEMMDQVVISTDPTSTDALLKENEATQQDQIINELGPHDALLTPAQLRMIKNLDGIQHLRKHLVWFPEGLNGHAMIVCRDPAQYPSHEQGRAVLRHWCDGFRL